MGLGEVWIQLDGLLVIAGRFVHLALSAQAVALLNGFLRGVCLVLRVPVRAAQAEGNRQRGSYDIKETTRHLLRVGVFAALSDMGLVYTTAGQLLARS